MELVATPATAPRSHEVTRRAIARNRRTITLEDGRLHARLAGQRSVAIFAESDGTFFYRRTSARLAFTRDASGAVTGLRLLQSGGRHAPARKLPPAATSRPAVRRSGRPRIALRAAARRFVAADMAAGVSTRRPRLHEGRHAAGLSVG